ncbi:hypothetical protein [Pseudoroseomonas sp. WGS1072]
MRMLRLTAGGLMFAAAAYALAALPGLLMDRDSTTPLRLSVTAGR